MPSISLQVFNMLSISPLRKKSPTMVAPLTLTAGVGGCPARIDPAATVPDLPQVERSAATIDVLGCFLVNRPDLLLEMLKTIDYPVRRLVLIHNPDSHKETNDAVDALIDSLVSRSVDLGHNNIGTVLAFHHHQNVGFSGGVNKIITATPDAPYWIVVSNDVSFNAGALAEIAHRMANTTDLHSTSCVWGLCGDPVSQYAAFVITARAIKTVG